MPIERPGTVVHHSEAVVDRSGVRMFHRPDDGARETALADIVMDTLALDGMAHLGDRSFIDYIGVRDGRAVAGIEFISRKQSLSQLMKWGGVFLKAETLKTARAFASVPLSIAWRGVFFFYDLSDGLYYQEARQIVGKNVTMRDNRQAAESDTEPGVAVQNLRLWVEWDVSRS